MDTENTNFHKARDKTSMTFLHQESLVPELWAILLKHGYSSEVVGVIDDIGTANASVQGAGRADFRSFYTPELARQLLERHALLFRIFPEFLPNNDDAWQ